MSDPILSHPPEAGALKALMNRLRSWFGGGTRSMPFDHAVAALLVHASALRGPASPARQSRIATLLRDYFGRDAAAVAGLVAAARREDAQAVDLHHFARAVNRHLPQEGRLAVLDMAAQVAFADRAGAEEEGFLRLLGGLLGISDHDRGIVQHRARSLLESTPQPFTP